MVNGGTVWVHRYPLAKLEIWMEKACDAVGAPMASPATKGIQRDKRCRGLVTRLAARMVILDSKTQRGEKSVRLEGGSLQVARTRSLWGYRCPEIFSEEQIWYRRRLAWQADAVIAYSRTSYFDHSPILRRYRTTTEVLFLASAEYTRPRPSRQQISTVGGFCIAATRTPSDWR